MPVLANYPVNWTGWYGGAIGGADYGRGSMVFPGLSAADMRLAGFFGGGTLGYDYKIGPWVYGLEGNVSVTNANASTQCAPLAADPNVQVPLFQTTCHDNLNRIVTATGRLGYAWTPRTWQYVSIGTEFALTDHWWAKREYDWLDFGTKSLTLSDGTLVNSSERIAQGKIGLNHEPGQ
jgi:opacity protein-like surface antigen